MNVTRTQLATRRRPTRRPGGRPEREIQKAILRYLLTRPDVWCWRSNSGAVTEGARFIRFGQKGQADITGWRTLRLGGQTIAQRLEIEVKRPGASPTIEQVVFLERAKRDGCCVIVASSVEDVIQGLA
jgi:hypothetical protein